MQIEIRCKHPEKPLKFYVALSYNPLQMAYLVSYEGGKITHGSHEHCSTRKIMIQQYYEFNNFPSDLRKMFRYDFFSYKMILSKEKSINFAF